MNQDPFLWLEIDSNLTAKPTTWEQELSARRQIVLDQKWAAFVTPVTTNAALYLVELIPLMDQTLGVDLQFTPVVVTRFEEIAVDMTGRISAGDRGAILRAFESWRLTQLWGAWPGGLTLGLPVELLDEAKRRIETLFESVVSPVEPASGGGV